jgi:hypothetical protein
MFHPVTHKYEYHMTFYYEGDYIIFNCWYSFARTVGSEGNYLSVDVEILGT